MTLLSPDEVSQMAQEVADHGHAYVHLWDSTKIASLLDEVVAARAALSSPPAPAEGEREGRWRGLREALAIVVDTRRAWIGREREAALVRDVLTGVEERIRPMIPADAPSPRPPSSPDPARLPHVWSDDAAATCSRCGAIRWSVQEDRSCAPSPDPAPTDYLTKWAADQQTGRSHAGTCLDCGGIVYRRDGKTEHVHAPAPSPDPGERPRWLTGCARRGGDTDHAILVLPGERVRPGMVAACGAEADPVDATSPFDPASAHACRNCLRSVAPSPAAAPPPGDGEARFTYCDTCCARLVEPGSIAAHRCEDCRNVYPPPAPQPEKKEGTT